MESSRWISFLTSQLGAVPMIIVYVIGLSLALVQWQRYPQVARCAFAGLLILLLNLVVGVALQAWLIEQARGQSARSLSLLMTISNVARSTMAAVGTGALILAVFGWRAPPRDIPPIATYR